MDRTVVSDFKPTGQESDTKMCPLNSATQIFDLSLMVNCNMLYKYE